MNLLRKIMTSACFAMSLTGAAQTVRVSGRVQTGQPYRHVLGRGLMLDVTTGTIAVRSISGAVSDNYAACATPPAHGPNPIDIEGWHFDPARSEAAPGLRRRFQFALTAKSNKMQCALAEASYHEDEVPGYRVQRLGDGVLTLSQVKLSALGDEVVSFQFAATIRLPRRR